MNTMARLLGRYQPPAVLLDASTLVSVGQHDIATISSLAGLRRELLSAPATDNGRESLFPGFSEPYQVIVFERAAKEYRRFFAEGVAGDYKIPKASYDVIEHLDCSEFPPRLQARIADARELWKSASSKSPQNRKKTGYGSNDRSGHGFGEITVLPSRTDQEILAFVLEQAENQRPCYVFSRDEDLIGPVKELAIRHSWIRYVGYSVERPSVLANGKTPVLATPEVIGSLYNMQQHGSLENYLLSTKVPFAGETVDMMVSVHPVNGPVRFAEGRAFRHLLNIHDIDQLTAVTGYKRGMLLQRDNDRLNAAAKAAGKKYPAISFVDTSRSNEGGVLRMGRVDRRTLLTSHGLSRDVTRAPELQWFLAYYSYLRDFSPETLESLRNFREVFSK